MLFLPASVYRSRQRLLKQQEAGKIAHKELYERTLELDQYDHVALFELGLIAEESGDPASAQEYFWRAIEGHPWRFQSHLRLSQLLSKDPEQQALSAGLGELGLRKLLLDNEAVHAVASERWDLPVPALENFQRLTKRDQYEYAAEVFARQQADEPPEVTARLRPHRLVHQVQQSIISSESTVNNIIAEGPLVVPLLIGLLRGVAQDYLHDDGVAERALALLGEIGDPAVLSELLEFATIDNEVLSGAAAWAIDRVLAVDPPGAGAVLRELAPGLDIYGRSVATVMTIKYPDADPDGGVLTQLTSNLKQFEKSERETLIVAVVQSILARRGASGVAQARGILAANATIVSSRARSLCEEELELVEAGDAPRYGVREEEEPSIYDICGGEVSWEEDDEDDEDFEEEDEDLIPSPIRKQPAPGRNDPCWCGGGKKYKKCHLAADEQSQQGPAEVVPDQFDSLRRQIGEFMRQALPSDEFRTAAAEFAGVMGPEPDPVALGDWIVHDRVSAHLGRTVVEEFLRRHGNRLSARERGLVESWSQSSFGLYEVQEVAVGKGAEVKDLLRDQTFFVHDISLSRSLVRWDGLLARVVEGERGQELTGVSSTVPRRSLAAFRQWLEADRQASGLDWGQYFKRNLPRILRRPHELSAQAFDELQLRNSDGDELMFSIAAYQVVDGAAVVKALEQRKELSVNEPGSEYGWLAGAADAGPSTVLGTIRIGEGELRLECNSRERLERGKKMLSRAGGAALRHLRDEFTTQKELKRQISTGGGASVPKPSSLPPEVEQRVLTEAMERHYGMWPDYALPALNGKTPREAVKTAAGREQVAALLRDFENGEERNRKEGRPYFDINRLRAELGLRHS